MEEETQKYLDFFKKKILISKLSLGGLAAIAIGGGIYAGMNPEIFGNGKSLSRELEKIYFIGGFVWTIATTFKTIDLLFYKSQYNYTKENGFPINYNYFG